MEKENVESVEFMGLNVVLTFDGGFSTYSTPVKLIDKKNKIKQVFLNYCPFCGTPYQEKEK